MDLKQVKYLLKCYVPFKVYCQNVDLYGIAEFDDRENAAKTKSIYNMLHESIEALPSGIKAVIYGTVNGTPENELAQMLGISARSIRAKKKKGLEELADLLTQKNL